MPPVIFHPERPPKPRQCPCGCGKTLRAYNGQVPLVCFAFWKYVPELTRKKLVWGDRLEKRAAARQIIKLAREEKLDRAEQQLLLGQ